MKAYPVLIILALATAAASVSCDKLRNPLPTMQAPPVGAQPPAQPDADRTSFAQAIQLEIDELRDAISVLKAKAESARADFREKLIEEAVRLEVERVNIQVQLGKLKNATGDSWKSLKETVRTAVDNLKSSVDKARSGSN
jgi:FtsZ-binding cell division protein ZapB